MTVSTLNSSTSSVANGTERTFYFDFALLEASHLDVYVVTASGTADEQSAYILDEGWGDSGGSITFNVDEQPADTLTVLMERNVPVTQETDYIPGDPFPAETHEDALDKLTMIVQAATSTAGDSNLNLSLDRCIVVPRGDTATDLELPPVSGRANEYLFFDADGNVTTTDQTTGTYEVTEWAKTLLDDEDAIEGRATLGYYATSGEFTKSQNFNMTALTDAASISWNADANQVCSVTLSANRAMGNPTNVKAGCTYVLTVIQDGTGSRTLSWGSAYKFEDATDPELSSGADEKTIIMFWSDGTDMYGGTFWKEVS